MKFRELRADEIEARVATVKKNGCSLLLYKDARCDMRILDETVGAESWQRKHDLINGNLFCSVGILSGMTGEWVWKQDVGTESYTEKEKGQASDSFKRACFNWGIGRELYTAPFIWIDAGNVGLKENGGKWTTSDRFKVKEISYTDGRITGLTITNESMKGRVVYQMGKKVDVPAEERITKKEADILKKMLADRDLPSETYDKTPIDKLTASQYRNAMEFLRNYKGAE